MARTKIVFNFYDDMIFYRFQSLRAVTSLIVHVAQYMADSQANDMNQQNAWMAHLVKMHQNITVKISSHFQNLLNIIIITKIENYLVLAIVFKNDIILCSSHSFQNFEIFRIRLLHCVIRLMATFFQRKVK